tara:strand:+ start:8419 stop:9855 length:1437 start_codon:yes stop_codon:yes gene_type:complete
MFLQGAADKLKREQAQRKAELHKRQASERRAAAVAESARRERDDLEKAERHEARLREAETRLVKERIMANNEGVSWEARLTGVRSDAAQVKGIRNRADDKVVLPASAWRALQNAGAATSDRGHLFFEVSLVNGESSRTHTHAAVLGFDGVEGEVGLPAVVLRQLGVSTAGMAKVLTNGETNEIMADASGDDGDERETDALAAAFGSGNSTNVLVSYRRLPKGTYCKLQPLTQEFQGELAVEPDVDLRALLEQTMTKRCTLTVGDDVVVESGNGKSYTLRCVEVVPDDANAVSLMETDIEVDIAPSEDYEAAMRRLAEMEQERLAAAAKTADDARTSIFEKQAAEEAMVAAAAKEALEEKEALERSTRFKVSAQKSLPPEPTASSSSDETFCVRFMFPDGKTKMRRFFKHDLLSAAFDFVKAEGGASEGISFRLVTRYPRVTVEQPDVNLGAITMNDSEEFVSAVSNGSALFVEKISQE